MYLHIGDDRVIPMQEIVAILQAESLEKAADSSVFLARAKELGYLRPNPGKRTSSYVVTHSCIYGSPLSAATLRRRAQGLHLSFDSENCLPNDGERGSESPWSDTE